MQKSVKNITKRVKKPRERGKKRYKKTCKNSQKAGKNIIKRVKKPRKNDKKRYKSLQKQQKSGEKYIIINKTKKYLQMNTECGIIHIEAVFDRTYGGVAQLGERLLRM